MSLISPRCSAILSLLLGTVACGHGDQSPGAPTSPTNTASTPAPAAPAPATWDLKALGIPRFIAVNYIALTQLKANGKPLVEQISKFRSSYGHAYGDRDEPCMSKKHYFSFPDSNTKIVSPVNGTVVHQNFGPGGISDRIEIRPDGYPAWYITIFHAVLPHLYTPGTHVSAGESLGHQVGDWTSSDIAVAVDDGGPERGTNYVIPAKVLVSYFDVLPDSVFALFQKRGVASRATMQISAEERAAHPLTCVLGTDAFDTFGPWFPDALAQFVPLIP